MPLVKYVSDGAQSAPLSKCPCNHFLKHVSNSPYSFVYLLPQWWVLTRSLDFVKQDASFFFSPPKAKGEMEGDLPLVSPPRLTIVGSSALITLTLPTLRPF